MVILPDPPPPPTAIGLIAGGGRLPVIVARGLVQAGHPVHGLGLVDLFDRELPGLCQTFRSVGLLRLGVWAKALAGEGVKHAIMVGKVDKARVMHDPLRLLRNIPDLRTIVAWYRTRGADRRSHALLGAIAEELDRTGVQLIDSTISIPDQMSTPGVMTQRQPTPEQWADIEFAWPMLADLMRLDIGQALAVREKDVLAVEALEGTDRMIERAGQVCRVMGWTLCKGARAGHDRRSDVPTIGVTTIRNLYEAGGRCLALAAGDVIMIDRDEVIDLADSLGVSIIGIPPGTGYSQVAVANGVVSSGLTTPQATLPTPNHGAQTPAVGMAGSGGAVMIARNDRVGANA